MRIFSFLLLAGAVALVAGCLDMSDDASTSGEGDGDGLGNMTTNETTSISMDFDAAGPGPLGPGGETFDVPENATQVLIEARWECTSPTCDVTITVTDENGTEVGTGSGNGQADITLEAPAAGTYTIEFSTDAPVAGVTGEARVTVFTGEVPDGFTAWEEEEQAREARRR